MSTPKWGKKKPAENEGQVINVRKKDTIIFENQDCKIF